MIVISLGGSRIIPSKIDSKFLLDFKKNVSKIDDKIAIVCGGGNTARLYQAGLREISVDSHKTLDRAGILATKMNAFIVKKLFSDMPNVSIYSGTVPGHSTDYVACQVAIRNKVKFVINLSNVKYVYTADPKSDKSAKKIKDLTYSRFEEIFGKRWVPGMKIPFDCKAAALCKKTGITVYFIDSVFEIHAAILGKSSGTIMHN
jgi:uridylate kinase